MEGGERLLVQASNHLSEVHNSQWLCRLETLKRDTGADVEVAIDPEELEGLSDADIKLLYEQRLSEERARHSREVGCSPILEGSLRLVQKHSVHSPSSACIREIDEVDLP